jgi:hypothetical protein
MSGRPNLLLCKKGIKLNTRLAKLSVLVVAILIMSMQSVVAQDTPFNWKPYFTEEERAALNDEGKTFLSYLDIYCMDITQLGGVHNFKRHLLDKMKDSAQLQSSAVVGVDVIIKRYWTTAYCEPRRIGGTMSPIVHLVAENPTDRNAYLVALRKYYDEKNDRNSFVEILNSKNSRGHTLLDYINYLYVAEYRNYDKLDEKPLNNLVQFLCDNGAKYSFYKKKCPAEYLTINW